MFWNIEAIVQAAFVVDDLDRGLDRWRARGAGPFMEFRGIAVPLKVHGRDVTLNLSLALGQLDGMQIELIQQHDRQPSAFTDSFPDAWPTGDDGFHHVGMISTDFDRTCAKMASEGFEQTISGAFGGYRVAFYDTRKVFGTFYEVFEGNEAMRGFFDRIKRGEVG